MYQIAQTKILLQFGYIGAPSTKIFATLLRFFNHFSPIFSIWEENNPVRANIFSSWLASWKGPSSDDCPEGSDLKNFLSPFTCKSTVKCDWSNKTSQNLRNLGFPWKSRWVFFSKKACFFQNWWRWQTVEWVLNDITSKLCIFSTWI